MKRRSFLKKVAASAVISNTSSLAPMPTGTAAAHNNTKKQNQSRNPHAAAISSTKRVAPSDRIRIGLIGAGSRGQEMMRYMLRVTGVSVQAICDIYEPRFAAARKITGEATPIFTDHRRLLEQPDLDAVLVATPLYLHNEHMLAAIGSDRHVYGEKSLGFTIDHCDRILKAAKESRKVFQVGHQYRYATWFNEAIKRVKAGEIGQVTHIYGYWHRNSDWRRSVPDPKFERLINWRMYKEFSGGLMAELGSHQIDLANWIFGGVPESVVGSGGVDFYKDGRETNDNVQATFRYAGGRTFTFSSITTNAKVGYQQVIYGTQGSVELTIEDAIFYYEPKRHTAIKAKTVVERGISTGATYSTKGEMPYRGPGEPIKVADEMRGNPNYVASAAFFESIRSNNRVFADVQVGYNSAVSVHLANRAIEEGCRIRFSDHVKGDFGSALQRPS